MRWILGKNLLRWMKCLEEKNLRSGLLRALIMPSPSVRLTTLGLALCISLLRNNATVLVDSLAGPVIIPSYLFVCDDGSLELYDDLL